MKNEDWEVLARLYRVKVDYSRTRDSIPFTSVLLVASTSAKSAKMKTVRYFEDMDARKVKVREIKAASPDSEVLV